MLEENVDDSVVPNMTTLTPKTKFAAAKKLLLALPFLAVLAAVVPAAQADQDHGFYRRHGYYRHHYHHRHYYYRHGHRYYGPRPGVNVNVGL